MSRTLSEKNDLDKSINDIGMVDDSSFSWFVSIKYRFVDK